MSRVRGRDHHYIGKCKRVLQFRENEHLRKLIDQLSTPPHDRRELQPFRRRNHRRMKHPPGQPIPNQCDPQHLYSTTTSVSPGFTVAPSATATRCTLPAFGDFNSFCIFIASITTTPAPASTVSPSLTSRRTTLPGIGAVTFLGPASPPAPARRDRSDLGSRNSACTTCPLWSSSSSPFVPLTRNA